MPDLERIIQSTPGTLSQQWYEDGAAVDPGTVTVGITRADGSVLVASAATTGTGTAARTYNLTTTHTALLDTLKVTWTSTLKGTLVSYVEVAGGFLFTVAEFRALGSAYANTTNYPTAAVKEMRTTVEQALEDACGVAFVPRYEQERVSGIDPRYYQYDQPLRTKWARVRALRSVTIDGATVTPLSGVGYVNEGLLYYTWSAGYGNVTVGYEHGYDAPPMRMKRAALILAKRWITPGSADDRAINVTNDTGTYALFQAGVRGHLFDVPEIAAAVQQYSLTVGVA